MAAPRAPRAPAPGEPDPGDDPRIQELEEMGLPERWIDVARTIGFDAFLAAWFVLDRDNLGLPSESREPLRVWIPKTSCYFRYQRNRYIEALADARLGTEEIRARVQRDLGQRLDVRTIYRVIRAGRERRGQV